MSDHMSAMEQCVQWKRERDEAQRQARYLQSRQEHFARVLGVADGGRYQADWDAAIHRVVAERDAAVAQRDELREALQHALDHLERIVYYDCAPFEVSSPFVWMDKTRKEGRAWQDEDGNYDVEKMVEALAMLGEV